MIQRFISGAAAIKEEAASALIGGCNIPPLLAHMLLQRGIADTEEAERFLHPSLAHLHDPALLPDMGAAIERIGRAIARREKICVYGDYDADGICATAMLAGFLEGEGAEVHAYLPSRHEEGYGLHESAVRRLHEAGIGLIITVDNGVTALSEVALCNSLGMEVVVTDHHQCGEELPTCVAVVNPHRPDSGYPFPCLCGAGVVLKLIQALGGELEDYLAVCALATVADVVALKGENRVIVSMGLPLIDRHSGLAALLRVSGSAGQKITSETLAFRIAPRLNAAGRMGDAARALRLLRSRDEDEILQIALELNEENTRRQNEECRVLKEIEERLVHVDMAGTHAILLASSDWNAGIIGIVAARLVERYYRPALLFHVEGDVLTGSCRSIPGVNILQCLQPFANRFIRFGGHALAAGITMEKGLFHGFCEDFEKHLKSVIPPELFLPTYCYEREVPIGALSMRDLEAMKLLAPYGEGNPRPVFYAHRVKFSNVAQMGKESQHARAMAVQGRSSAGLVAFGYGDQARDWTPEDEFDMLYMSDLNEWQGQKRIQLQLKSLKCAGFLAASGFTARERRKFYDEFFGYFLYNVTRVCIFEAKADRHVRVLHALQSGIHGMVVICATPEGAEECKTLLQQNGLIDRVQVFWNAIPKDAPSYHTLLLAPGQRELNTGRFHQVIYFDWPVASDDLELEMPHAGFLAPLHMQKEQMAEIYRGFLRMLKRGKRRKQELLAAQNGFSYEALLLALLTFVELGFMMWEPHADTIEQVPGCESKDLINSVLYASARSQRFDIGGSPRGFEALCEDHTRLPERGHSVSGYYDSVEG